MADQDFTVASSFTIANDALTPYLQNLSAQLSALDAKLATTKSALSSLGTGSTASSIKSTTSALQEQINSLTGVTAGNKSAYESAQVFALALGNTRNAAAQAAPAVDKAAASVRGLHASAGPARAGIVLLHEAISGRFSRIPGSLLVMGEYFGGIGPAALASVVGVGALAFAVYEFAKNAIEAENAIRGVEGAAAQLGQVPTGQHRNGAKEIEQGIEDLSKKYGLSTVAAAEWSQAVRSNMKVSSEEGVNEILKLSAAVAESNNQWDKLPDIAKDLAKKTQSFEGLKAISDDLHLGMDGMISEAEQGGQGVVAAFQKMVSGVDKQMGAMAEATGEKHAAFSWKNIFLSMGEGELGAAGAPTPITDRMMKAQTIKPTELIPPPPVPRDQPDPEIKVKQQIAAAEAQIAQLRNDRTKTEAEVAASVSAVWASIKLPDNIAKGDEEVQKVLNQRRDTANAAAEAATREQAQAIQSKFAAQRASGTLSPAGVAASQVEEQRQLLALAGNSANERIRYQQELATAQAALSGAATAQQLHDLQTLVDKTREGTTERVAAEQKVSDFAASHYAKGSSQVEEATRALETAQRELSRKQAEDADIKLSGQAKNLSDNATIDLDKIKSRPQKGILADPSELAAEQTKIIASSAIAVAAIEKQREALFADDLNKQDEIENQRVHGVEEALAKITELERSAAQQTEQEWDKVNKDIGDGLSRSIMDGLEGKKGGIGAGLKEFADKQLQQALSSGISSTAGFAESELGIDKDKQSPGGLVASGASALGLGDVAKFFGIGGKQDKDQGLITSNQKLITALQTLTDKINPGGAGGPQQAPAQSGATVDVAQQANTQQLQSVGNEMSNLASITGEHSTATEVLGAATKINTLAILPNTIATIGNTIAQYIEAAAALLPFAEGGNPPVGVPSIVGEKGPELFVPHGAGTIISNDKSRKMLGGSAVNDNAISSAYQNSGAGFGTQYRAGDTYGAARENVRINGGDTSHATVNQTNHFSASGNPPTLEKQLAEHVKTAGHSATRTLVKKAVKK